MRVVRLNRLMLQRRICGVATFLAFVYWASLTLNFFGLRTPLITGCEEGMLVPKFAGLQRGEQEKAYRITSELECECE